MDSNKTVTAAIILDQEKILIARRAEDQKYGGFWEFPGGKLEPGESEFECIERELMEELGVRAFAEQRICHIDHPIESGTIRLVAIKTRLSSDDFRLTAHSEIAWIAFDELGSANLLPADISLIAKMREFANAGQTSNRADDQ